MSLHSVRENLRELSKEFDRSEDDLKALQSGVGQIVGEVLRQLTEDKCEFASLYITQHYSLCACAIRPHVATCMCKDYQLKSVGIPQS